MKKVIETERLYLREITRADFDEFYALQTDPEVMRFIGNGEIRTDKEALRLALDKIIANYQSISNSGLWATVKKSDDTFVGWHCIKPIPNTDEIEIGYWLHKRYWGKGYASEMGQPLIQYGFEVLQLDRIIGITHPDNLASQRVLMKCGLDYEKQAFFYNSNVHYFSFDRPKIFGMKSEHKDRSIACGVCIKDDKVLAIQHKQWFFLPGGGIEQNETPVEALKREFLEETGYAVEVVAPIGKANYFNPQPFGNDDLKTYSKGHFYRVLLKDKVHDAVEEHHIPVWLSLEDCKAKINQQHHLWAIRACFKNADNASGSIHA